MPTGLGRTRSRTVSKSYVVAKKKFIILNQVRVPKRGLPCQVILSLRLNVNYARTRARPVLHAGQMDPLPGEDVVPQVCHPAGADEGRAHARREQHVGFLERGHGDVHVCIEMISSPLKSHT